MIKAVIGNHEGKGPLLILGLSRLNVERLVHGAPILFDLGNMGYRLVPDVGAKEAGGRDNGCRVMIAAGEDEQTLARGFGFPDVGPAESGKETRIFKDPVADSGGTVSK